MNQKAHTASNCLIETEGFLKVTIEWHIPITLSELQGHKPFKCDFSYSA